MAHDTTEFDELINKRLRTHQNRTYTETLETLFALLRQANLADSLQAYAWQEADDASAAVGCYYRGIRDAIIAIAGHDILNHESETGNREEDAHE